MTKHAFLLALLLGACQGPPSSEPGLVPAQLAYLRAVGDVALRVDGTAALRKYAPEAFPLIDVAPADGVITLAEVEAVVAAAQDPVQLTWLLLMVRGMIEARD